LLEFYFPPVSFQGLLLTSLREEFQLRLLVLDFLVQLGDLGLMVRFQGRELFVREFSREGYIFEMDWWFDLLKVLDHGLIQRNLFQ